MRNYLSRIIACLLVASGFAILPAMPAAAGNGTIPAGVTINSYGPNWDLTVDCSVFVYGPNSVDIPGRVADTLTVHTTNCGGGYIYDLTTDYDYSNNQPSGFDPRAESAEWGASPVYPDTWRATPIPSTFTLTPGSVFYFNSPDYQTYKYVAINAAPEIDDPSGALAYRDFATFSPDSPRFTAVGGGFFHYLNGDTNCRMVEGEHPYSTIDVTISQAGEYTFRFVEATPNPSWLYSWMGYHPVQDTLLAVYTNFDPADPESNVVSCNDDGKIYPEQVLYTTQSGRVISVSCPQFTATLDPAVSTRYTLVMTTYNAYSVSLWNSMGYGVGQGTFEMWGPAGGFSIPSFDVNFDTQGGSSVAPTTYLASGSIDLPSPPNRSGYTFLGWFAEPEGGDPLSSPFFPELNQDITLYAQWSVEVAPAATATLPDTGLATMRLAFTGLALVGLGCLFSLARASVLMARTSTARRQTYIRYDAWSRGTLRRGLGKPFR